MTWQYTPYALPALSAAGFCMLAAVYMGRHQRHARGAGWFVVFLLAAGFWSLTSALEIMAAGLPAKWLWIQMQTLGAALTSASGFLFVATLDEHQQWFTRRRLALAALAVGVPVLLALTNAAHHWMWLGEPSLITSGPLPVVRLTLGPGGWLCVLGAYGLAGLVLMRVLIAATLTLRLYRPQALALLGGALLPIAADVITRLGFSPIPGFNLTPLGFALGGLLLTIVYFGFNRLDLLPLARHLIIENLNDAVLVLDKHARMVDLNPAAETALSLTADRAVSRPAPEVLAPHPALSALVEALPAQPTELTLGAAETARHYLAQFTALTHPSGRSDGWLVTLRDITAHKRVEAELRHAETAEREQNRFLRLLNALTQATLEQHDFLGILQTTADQLRELFAADHCFITLWDEVHERAQPTVASGPFRESYSTYKPKPTERTLTNTVLQAGRVIALEDALNTPEHISRSIPARFDSRGVLGLPLIAGQEKLGAVFITYRRPHAFSAQEIEWGEQVAQQVALAIGQAQLWRAVLDEHNRMQTVIEASRDGIVLVGPDRRILTINTPALLILQLPGLPEDWQGRPVRALLLHLRPYAPEVVRTLLAEMRRLRLGDEPANEGEFQVPPRTLHWFNLPVHTEGVRASRLLVLHDMTQERQLTAMRDELTHMMVHDLRSPLGTISTALEFLRVEALGRLAPEAEQTLEIACESTTMTLDLVNAILDVSRLEGGQFALERAPASLADICAEVVRLHSPALQASGLRVHNHLSQYLPPVWIDAPLIGRVIQNLLNNAIKFTPPGGAIQLSAMMEGRKPPQLVVLVSDTGPGIDPYVHERLFQKFVTGRPAPGQARRGSGLGLAFCKLVIEAHGGHIWAESQAGRGATFLFTLPILPETVPVNEDEASALAVY